MKNIIEALIKLQTILKNPPKTRKAQITSTRSYSYADLTEVIELIKPLLAQCGLVLWQRLALREDGIFGLVTELAHVSGETIQSFYPLQTGMKPQDFGSALTYARRYSIMSLLFINGDEDLDGEILEKGPASKIVNPQIYDSNLDAGSPPPYDWDGIAGPQEPTIIKKSKITDKQAKLLVARAFSNKWSNKDLQGFFLKRFNVKELKDLDFKEMDTAVKYVSKPFMEAMKDTGESPF